MSASIAHRGPDGYGEWIDEGAGIALAHRRLAIIDVSEAGRQPMVSANGNFILTFNGEIYNFRELRVDLLARGARIRTASDSEILVEAIATWGIDAALARLNGIFAFAVFDRAARLLHLARDPVGVKPLFWTPSWDRIFFSSELRAIAKVAGEATSPDPGAAAAYFQFGYVPGPQSILSHIEKLEPGMLATVSADRAKRTSRFWSLRDVVEQRCRINPARSIKATQQDLVDSLRGAVRRQLIADVPVGAFLSGGIDSSLVVALAQSELGRPIKTFSVGFDDGLFDEAPEARRMARVLGSDHTEIYVNEETAIDAAPRLATIHDEPFGDPSLLPTWIVSRLAREQVKVVLSGDGGDELFCGYTRYRHALRLTDAVRSIPAPMRTAIGVALSAVPFDTLDRAIGRLDAWPGLGGFGRKVERVASVLRGAGVYPMLMSQFQPGENPMCSSGDAAPVLGAPWTDDWLPNLSARMSYIDMLTYLPEDILSKVDRASMNLGLEVRVPLLDVDVVALAWSLPTEAKTDGDVGKLPLRALLADLAPTAEIQARKKGFAPPIGAWLRGGLRDWADALLSPATMEAAGIVRPDIISCMWRDHLRGADRQYPLWTALMYLSWMEHRKEIASAWRGNQLADTPLVLSSES